MAEEWELRNAHLLLDLDDENIFRQFAFDNNYGDSAYAFRRLLEKAGLRNEQDSQTHHGGSTNPERGGLVDPASTHRAPSGSPVMEDQFAPSKSDALKRGCTCKWWGGGSIIEFDPNCPILTLHRGWKKQIIQHGRLERPELFMQVAELFAGQSTCLRGNVGAVIVKDRRIISCGYNGAPPGMTSCIDAGECDIDPVVGMIVGCKRSTHAEANAIAWAARVGVPVIDSTMYATHSPCLACARLCIAAGILRYVYRNEYRITEGKELLDRANIPIHKL